ncbi:MAG: deoxyguanosinetriphosphate triphosphohydrolase [Hyphomicrobiaceae bacterium]|nr:deoxyguanosinetriphosphate triphosphohydrolase [Hyphomicrobiaceae bacterium]
MSSTIPSDIGFGGEARAPYAVDWRRSLGRIHAEDASPTRTPYQRDRDRIIHSSAFRRLKHKTQVFIYHEGDHYRTRLTHTIEVAQITRALARALRLDEDLAEAIALAHDLGHPPFGHIGEHYLHKAMGDFGGFDHNAQSLRVVARLERRYPEFDGLNLAWETLEGLVKHNGPLVDADGRPLGAHHGDPGELPFALREVMAKVDLRLSTFASLEAQCAAIADDIAYVSHDIDDGLRARLLSLDAVEAMPFAGPILAEVRARYPGLERDRLIAELIRRIITRLVEDVIVTATATLREAAPADVEAVRRLDRAVVTFSPEVERAVKGAKQALFTQVYRSDEVNLMMHTASAVLKDLFETYRLMPSEMPPEWNRDLDPRDRARVARRACDYVAGMTDRFCLQEFERLFPGQLPKLGALFDAGPELR